MAPPTSGWDQQMRQLETEIRRLEAEFNMFFAGRLPRPPAETRARVAALVKKHDQTFIRNTADRFRFESLQNRYSKFIELVERQMTNRELGRPVAGVRRVEEPPPPRRADPKKAPQAEPGMLRFARDQQLSAQSELVKKLFDQLADAKKQVGESPVAIERLAALVRAQVDKFAAVGKDVTFKVAMKDGKVSLTAKPTDD
ncbi:MAG: MXAN_5187 C-terminal domain-containing protein [Vicinamibacterales bacterium]